MSGPEHVVDYVNDMHRRMFASERWVGKTIRHAFPSPAGQGFFELLDKVDTTGATHQAEVAEIRLHPSKPTDCSSSRDEIATNW